jgi:hypothetical protein
MDDKKGSGYSEELTKEIVSEYLAQPTRETANAIAARIGKSPRSVIAKLAAAGVYRAPERTTKTGDPIVKKDELVEDINKWLGLDLTTLAKTGKLDLKALHGAIEKLVGEEDE